MPPGRKPKKKKPSSKTQTKTSSITSTPDGDWAASEDEATPVPAKRKYPPQAPKEITLSDGTKMMEAYHNENPVVPRYPAVQPDPEEVLGEPQDEVASHSFPPPRKSAAFRSRWALFIDSVTSRPNFKVAHLEALSILCDLYVQYDILSKVIRKEGMTYETVNRLGRTIRTRPEVALLSQVKKDIAMYTKGLDLFPKKDKSIADPIQAKEDWD